MFLENEQLNKYEIVIYIYYSIHLLNIPEVR